MWGYFVHLSEEKFQKAVQYRVRGRRVSLYACVVSLYSSTDLKQNHDKFHCENCLEQLSYLWGMNTLEPVHAFCNSSRSSIICIFFLTNVVGKLVSPWNTSKIWLVKAGMTTRQFWHAATCGLNASRILANTLYCFFPFSFSYFFGVNLVLVWQLCLRLDDI